jgi:2,4-diketo-3-deoxy-L-fuconate hydrolase
MRLLRVGDPGDERPAVEDGDEVFDLSSITSDIDGAFLADDGIRRVRDALGSGGSGGLARLDIIGRRLGHPSRGPPPCSASARTTRRTRPNPATRHRSNP